MPNSCKSRLPVSLLIWLVLCLYHNNFCILLREYLVNIPTSAGGDCLSTVDDDDDYNYERENRIKIYVAIDNNKQLLFHVHPHTRIHVLKKLIKIHKQISINLQQLFYQNKLLDDQNTLQDYHIGANSALHLVQVD